MAQTLKFGNGTWATKKGSTLAYNDLGGNFKPLPFTYTGAGKGTRVNKEGLIEVVENDRPRIDYTDSEDGVFLLEKAATNLITYSEDFENSDWTKNGGTTITNNYAISPDGSLNASRYLGTGTSGLGDKFTLSATSYTLSFYVKSNTSENYFCRLIGDTSNVSENLLITTEWTRLSYTFTGSGLSNQTNGLFRDSSNNDMDILIYGAQLEQGSYATSYIPTSGSAVTRVGDVCNNGGNEQVINSTEGVLYFEGQSFGGTSNGFITLSDGSSTNRISLRIGYYISTLIYIQMTSSGTPQFEQLYNTSGTSFNFNDFNKYALKYKQNDCALFLNGVKVTSISSATMPTNLSKLQFTNSDGVGFPFLGTQKDTRLYNTALTDQELIALTS